MSFVTGVADMTGVEGEISRISKIMMDREQADPSAILDRRKNHSVLFRCGDDVASSYTLQLAVLTAAQIATRCFPGAVRANLSPALANAQSRLWPWCHLTFGAALAEIIGERIDDADGNSTRVLLFGDATLTKGALRVTFDGWVAKVGPADRVARLQERQYLASAGALAASLALSELFLSFAGISIEAGRREVGLSLWRPDLAPDDPNALGIPVEFLPKVSWLLGLGHLGNAYLWSLATLPYASPEEVAFYLLDFDVVVTDNVETGLLFKFSHINQLKAHACDAWLSAHGFDRNRLVERRFDKTFEVQDGEPRLAFCGFDNNAARRDLVGDKFDRVIESGLGGTANNFDTISLHTLPNPRSVKELWPDITREEQAKIDAAEEKVAAENPAYRKLEKDICGRRDLAGKSVPFVGVTAASFVVAEAIKLFHNGPAFHGIKLSLGAPTGLIGLQNETYSPRDSQGLAFTSATNLQTF
jgi:hypothetical protein